MAAVHAFCERLGLSQIQFLRRFRLNVESLCYETAENLALLFAWTFHHCGKRIDDELLRRWFPRLRLDIVVRPFLAEDPDLRIHTLCAGFEAFDSPPELSRIYLCEFREERPYERFRALVPHEVARHGFEVIDKPLAAVFQELGGILGHIRRNLHRFAYRFGKRASQYSTPSKATRCRRPLRICGDLQVPRSSKVEQQPGHEKALNRLERRGFNKCLTSAGSGGTNLRDEGNRCLSRTSGNLWGRAVPFLGRSP